MKNKTLMKTLSALLAVVVVFSSAPLSGFVGLELPDLFSLKAEAEEYTEDNFVYFVSDGGAILTGCIDATGAVLIPETLGGYPVMGIARYAFENCTSLTSVTIPCNVLIIDAYTFRDCTNLARVYYTGNIESWCSIEFDDYYANPMYYAENFYINGVLVKEIVIPDTVTEIKNYTFCGFEGVTSITMHDKVTSIGDYAFYHCTSLVSITIPDSVTIIGDYAFGRCTSLEWITVGKDVLFIGGEAFEDCTSLARVYYTGDIKSWCGIVFANYNHDYGANPMYYAKNFYINNDLVKEIVIPETVTEIKEYAFCGFGCVKSITIPDSVTSIGDYAFYDCTGLVSIMVSDSVTSIGDYAFAGCINLALVTVGKSVIYIGEEAFDDCYSLEDVYYTGSIDSWCGIEFYDCYATPMYYAKNFYLNDDLLKEIVIPETVKEIKDYTFGGFEGVTSITIPDSVTSIGVAAFAACISVVSITIPDSVTNVGLEAFGECKNLASVVIGKGITHIEDLMFYNCIGLTSIVMSDSVASIGDSAFYDCSNLAFVTIPASVTTIYSDAFAYCKNIENVYYGGTDAQWEEIIIYDGNECLKNSNKTFLDGAHAHAYNLTVITEPTCTESAIKTFKCNCGDTYTETIPATGHTWSNWIVTLEPTAIQDGRKVRVCTVCIEVAQEEIISRGTNTEEPSEPETKLFVKVNDLSIDYKGTKKLNPEIKASSKYEVKYSSSNESVVTVDKNGNVTATGEGIAEITVTVTDANGNSAKDICKVTVAKSWWQWLITIFLFGWLWY